MKKTSSILVFFLVTNFFLNGCLDCIQGSGNVVSKTMDVDEFHSVSIEGQGNLYITQGEEQSLRIDAEDNILEVMETEVSGGKLTVSTGLKCIRPTKPINIYVTMMDVNSLSVSGSGKIQGETPINTDILSVSTSGSGESNLEVNVSELNTAISGSGKETTRGVADMHSIRISGSGKIYGYELVTRTTDISISGSGTCEVHATEELDVLISGSGNIYYKGDPEVSESISGSGKVEKTE